MPMKARLLNVVYDRAEDEVRQLRVRVRELEDELFERKALARAEASELRDAAMLGAIIDRTGATPCEVTMLLHLALHPGVAMSHQSLLLVARRFHRSVSPVSTKVRVCELRRKLQQNAGRGLWIETVVGFGYRMAVRDAERLFDLAGIEP